LSWSSIQAKLNYLKSRLARREEKREAEKMQEQILNAAYYNGTHEIDHKLSLARSLALLLESRIAKREMKNGIRKVI
jgi:hypothetical protein